MLNLMYEFLMWDNCNNNCKFCFQRKNHNFKTLDEQHEIVQNTKLYIQKKIHNFSDIVLLGGELFDDSRRFFLLDLFNFLSNSMEKQIKNVYVNTNLIYDTDSFELLYRCFDFFFQKKYFNRICLTTSYDICGRFSDSKKEQFFFENISKLKKWKIKKTVNVILTRQMCEAILENRFNIFQFMKNYDVKIIFLPYIILNNELSASKELIFRTLSKLKNNYPCFFNDWINWLNIKDKRYLLKYQNNQWEHFECGISNCGHSENFKLYSDNNMTCFICDVNRLFYW